MREKIRAVVFDLNGVITTDMNKALGKLNAVYGTSLPLDRLRAIWNPLYIEASLGRITPDELWLQLRQSITPGSLPTGYEEEDWLSNIHLREPLIAHTLAQLKAKYMLGLMSNYVGRWARALLERFDLMRLLDAVLISSDIGLRKPSHVLYERICQFLGVQPGEAVYVADEEEDLLAAQAVGMLPVFIPAEGTHSSVRVHIERISDLLPMLL